MTTPRLLLSSFLVASIAASAEPSVDASVVVKTPGLIVKGSLGGLAVFERALSDEEMKRLHVAANITALEQP